MENRGLMEVVVSLCIGSSIKFLFSEEKRGLSIPVKEAQKWEETKNSFFDQMDNSGSFTGSVMLGVVLFLTGDVIYKCFHGNECNRKHPMEALVHENKTFEMMETMK